MKNLVILIGNLGNDPELKNLDNGNSVCNASLATSESYKDKNSGEKITTTEWHNLQVWGKGAEIFQKFLNKGSKVYIEGSIKTNKWQDKDGNDRYTTNINVKDFKFLDSKGESTQPNNQSPPQSNQNNNDDDLPF